MILLLVAGELFARFYLGLGDPPLTMNDAEMGYRFRPSMTYHRFGHLIHYNAFSERSDDFPAHKSQPNELRVMLLGDSVINGGVLTDQSETCTAILQRRLSEELHRPVLVGNASAGGWGTPNEVGYVHEFGFLDADVVVLVVSSHDASVYAWDVSVAPEFVQERPVSALWEGFTRYARAAAAARKFEPAAPPTSQPAVSKVVEPGRALVDQTKSIAAAREIIERARAGGVKMIVGCTWRPTRLTPRRNRDMRLSSRCSIP